LIRQFAHSLALAGGGALAAAALVSASPGAASPAPTLTTSVTACVDAKTRAMFLAASDGTCAVGRKAISWPGRLDPALVTKLDAALASSLTSARNLRSRMNTLASELASDQKKIAQLQAAFASETRVSARVKTLDELSQQTQKELQQGLDGDSSFLSTISNVLKKLTDTDSSVVSNLK